MSKAFLFLQAKSVRNQTPALPIKPFPNLDGNDSTDSSGSDDGSEATIQPVSQVFPSTRSAIVPTCVPTATPRPRSSEDANYRELMNSARLLEANTQPARIRHVSPPRRVVLQPPGMAVLEDDYGLQAALEASLMDMQTQAVDKAGPSKADIDRHLMPPPEPRVIITEVAPLKKTPVASATTTTLTLETNTVEAEAEAQIEAEVQPQVRTQAQSEANDDGLSEEMYMFGQPVESQDMFEDVSDIESLPSNASDLSSSSEGDETDYTDEEDIRNDVGGPSQAERKRAMQDVLLAPLPKRRRTSRKAYEPPPKEEVKF